MHHGHFADGENEGLGAQTAAMGTNGIETVITLEFVTEWKSETWVLRHGWIEDSAVLALVEDPGSGVFDDFPIYLF